MHISILIASLLVMGGLSGCHSMQPSTYQSVSTAEKTTISATGSAADVAARSTGVAACHTCSGSAAVDQPSSRPRQPARPHDRYQRATGRVPDRAPHTAAMRVSVDIDEVIKDIFNFRQ